MMTSTGLTPAGSVASARDLTHDLTNWKWTWGHAFQTTLDALGTIPLVRGLVKAGQAAVRGLGAAGDAFAAARKLRGGDEALRKLLPTGCLAPGTPLITPGGPRPIEELRVGDLVLSAPEDDASAEPSFRPVDRVFTGRMPVVTIGANGREILATAEHPFWVEGSGWRPASSLRPGDRLRSHDGAGVAVDGVSAAGGLVAVHNLSVAGSHTYFIGAWGWGFSAWAHNNNLDCFGDLAKAPKSGLGSAKRLSPDELATGQRLEAKLGKSVSESSHVGAEYVDDLGKTYDALGTPKASQFWNESKFLKSIDGHLLKSNDFTVIDLTGFTPSQIAAVERHLATLTPEQLARIMRIGF